MNRTVINSPIKPINANTAEITPKNNFNQLRVGVKLVNRDAIGAT
jgi:hypothetical protein